MSHVRACGASVVLAAVVGTTCILATYSRLSHTLAMVFVATLVTV